MADLNPNLISKDFINVCFCLEIFPTQRKMFQVGIFYIGETGSSASVVSGYGLD
jgi:hypothetical protein